MNTLNLRIAMVGTVTAIIGLSTLFLTFILSLFEVFSFYTLGLFIVLFNILQWLISPYLIDFMYRVKKVSKVDEPELRNMIERLSSVSHIKTPQLMISKIPIPNAFAYGSPLTGNRVAITRGLLSTLDAEEVEAVIGHELGHLKHHDVQVMMFVSILPALFYYLGYSMMWSSAYSRGDQRNNTASVALIGFISIVVYWVLTLFTLYLSRLREYYADGHSATTVHEGSRKLSEGLVKIAESTQKMRGRHRNTYNMNALKTLFISDPDSAARDLREIYKTTIWGNDRELVSKYLNRKITSVEQMAELFSTHPNLVKRLRAIQSLS